MITLQQLQSDAEQLSLADRGALTEFLLGTLDQDQSEAVQTEWLSLAHQRLEELRTGQVVGVSASEVLRAMSESGS